MTTLACSRPTKAHPTGRTGTNAGYMAHYKAGEDACPSCLPASGGNYSADKRRRALLRRHGLTEQAYVEMVEEQGGRCAICGRVPDGRLYIDHDHSCCPGENSCGECVRGLLCSPCNLALGHFGDDIARLRSALRYLEGLRLDEERMP